MPTPEFWDTEDEWYTDTWGTRHRHSRPRHGSEFHGYHHHHGGHLSPEHHTFGAGLHRTRSQGHRPMPNVTIYNTVDADANPRLTNQHVSPHPSPRPSPRVHPVHAVDELALQEEIAALRLDLARRSSPSYAQANASAQAPGVSRDQMQLHLATERLKEQERLREQEALRDRLRKEYELEKERKERKRFEKEREEEEERKRIITENQLKLDKAAREEKEARKQAIDEYERKKREEKEEMKRAVAKYEQRQREEEEERKELIAKYNMEIAEKKRKEKEAEDALKLKMAMEEEAAKKKSKEEYEAFLRRQKEEQDKAEAEKKRKEAELEDEMRKRLSEYGFQNNQIQAMIKPEKSKDLAPGLAPGNPLPRFRQPTYVKVHRDHLSIDTLTYYDIPWEYDRDDTSFIIILREMDQKETDILFEHTRRLRTRGTSRLLIEDRSKHDNKPEYAWVRKKKSVSRSPSRRRSSPKRVVGIRELLL